MARTGDGFSCGYANWAIMNKPVPYSAGVNPSTMDESMKEEYRVE